MKHPFLCRLLTATLCCLFFSLNIFAQANNVRRVEAGKQPEKPLSISKPAQPATALVKPTLQTPPPPMDCNNDQTAPVVQCSAGSCRPDARVGYLVSADYGEPWGRYDNPDALNNVFGWGNWDALYFENVDPNQLFSPQYKVVFLEGSDYSGNAMADFLSNYLPAMENWVNSGGALFINCAGNYVPNQVNLGFGGVTLQSFIYNYNGSVLDPGHVIFNGPYAPANGDFYGNYFQLASINGDYGQALIGDPNPGGTGVCLAVKNWGAGKVYFGGVAIPSWDGPSPNVYNMWYNILEDLGRQCNQVQIVPADAASCIALIQQSTFDATASDDCKLVSLTHNLPGAPSNTSLTGAQLPGGITAVTWTAADEAGNTATCIQNILVQEPEAPAIQCPGDMTVTINAENCSAKATFDITATDNCDPAPKISTYPPSNLPFPWGTTTVQATATDISGNTATCLFNVSVEPGQEICNGIDDDCNGWIDDGAPGDNAFFADQDYDGYGNPNIMILACQAPYGYVANANDCDDTNYYIYPGAYEYCDGLDNNCDGQIDEGYEWYLDADKDGYGDPATAVKSCQPVDGYVFNAVDCDDSNPYIHPGAMEDCTNDVDENCDGILGENDFSIEVTHTDVNCGSNPDGSATITMKPAQNYPVMLWSNGATGETVTNLADGTYTVTVTNECGTSKTKTVSIAPADEPALQVSFTGTARICGDQNSGAIQAIASDGCGGYTYEWNTGAKTAAISDLNGGVYYVTITDACGCTRSGSFTIEQPQTVGLYAYLVYPLLDGTYFVLMQPYGGFAPFQFRRSTGGGFTDWASSNGFVGVTPGETTFEVMDAAGCTNQATVYLNPINGQMEERTSNDETQDAPPMANRIERLPLRVVPNPNTGSFTVTFDAPAAADFTLAITDFSGKMLHSQVVAEGEQQPVVDVPTLPSGIYLLQVMSAGRVVGVEKFVKE